MTLQSESGERGEALPLAISPQPSATDPASLSWAVPLCVDLDGTLVKSDTLVESVLALGVQNPRALVSALRWLPKGKAAFKRRVTEAASLDVSSLPYNRSLLDYLAQQRAAGRKIVLATAADRGLAERIAEHCGIFADVLASDGFRNLLGENKLQALQQRFGANFCYVGNSKADLPLLVQCIDPMVANPSPALISGLRSAGIMPVKTFHDSVSPWNAWLDAIQPRQSARNLLVFVPLVLGRAWREIPPAFVAFISFSLCSSAIWVLAGLLDLEADRRHNLRRGWPFVAGNLSAATGLGVSLCLWLASLVLPGLLRHFVASIALTDRTLGWISVYAFGMLAYVLVLRRIPLLHQLSRAVLYVVPLLAGFALIGIGISGIFVWLRDLPHSIAGSKLSGS